LCRADARSGTGIFWHDRQQVFAWLRLLIDIEKFMDFAKSLTAPAHLLP
jgi:hypothetical protein